MDRDVKIIQECLDGDTDRFAILVRKYQDGLLRAAYHYLGNWSDAGDAVQEAFIRAFRFLRSYRTQSPFSVWLYRILLNVCRDSVKAAYRRYRRPLESIPAGDPPADALERLSERELVQKAVAGLTEKRRRALILTEILGFSGAEASKIMGCSESTLRVTCMKARQQLRKIYLELNT